MTFELIWYLMPGYVYIKPIYCFWINKYFIAILLCFISLVFVGAMYLVNLNMLGGRAWCRFGATCRPLTWLAVAVSNETNNRGQQFTSFVIFFFRKIFFSYPRQSHLRSGEVEFYFLHILRLVKPLPILRKSVRVELLQAKGLHTG